MTDEQKRDARLAHQILSGDEDAFAELNALYKQRICEFIASKIGDWHHAEELTQDTFLKVKQHLQTLREPEKVLNWMFRIANQLVAGWHRKNQRRGRIESFAEVSVIDMESAAANACQLAETDALDEERYINLFAVIAQLPELEQKIFRHEVLMLPADTHSETRGWFSQLKRVFQTES